MKKTIFTVLLLLILIGTSNICYADVVYEPSVSEVAIEMVGGYAELVGQYYIIIPLIILYGILVKCVIARYKEKSKKVKIKKCLILLIPIIILSISIVCINKVITYNVETNIKYGYVDSNNNFVIEPKFEYAKGFYDGLAKIGIESGFGPSMRSRYC